MEKSFGKSLSRLQRATIRTREWGCRSMDTPLTPQRPMVPTSMLFLEKVESLHLICKEMNAGEQTLVQDPMTGDGVHPPALLFTTSY